jgi:hypothetical protein
MEFVRQSWAFRTDPRLRPYVEKIAASECIRPSDVVRRAIVEYLVRNGALRRASDLAADRTEAA